MLIGPAPDRIRRDPTGSDGCRTRFGGCSRFCKLLEVQSTQHKRFVVALGDAFTTRQNASESVRTRRNASDIVGNRPSLCHPAHPNIRPLQSLRPAPDRIPRLLTGSDGCRTRSGGCSRFCKLLEVQSTQQTICFWSWRRFHNPSERI